MKKFILILATVLLFGCERKVVEEEKISETSKQEENLAQKEFLFKKNQECAKWVPKIEERLKEIRDQQLRENKLLPWLPSFQEIFYSPKTNSCLYIDNVQMGDVDPFTMKRLVDVSDGVGVDPVDDMSCQYVSNFAKYREIFGDEEIYESCDEFDRKIEEEYK